ncbi:hypothetical protein P3T26_003980 [Streptomyces sp. MAA16]|nr:hypothetical protein [Streptomyces sp. MAA16]
MNTMEMVFSSDEDMGDLAHRVMDSMDSTHTHITDP